MATTGAERRLQVPVRAQDAAPAGKLDLIFVLSSLAVGGSETKVVRLANALQRRGVQVGVAYLNAPHDLLEAVEPQVPIWHLDRRGKYSLASGAALWRLVREHRPAMLIAVNLYPTLYVLLAKARHDPRPLGVALVNTTTFAPHRQWRRFFYAPILRCLDWTVYGCELQRRMWLARKARTLRRSCVIYNGVDTRHFNAAAYDRSLRAQYGIGEHVFVFGSVGRLAPEKGQSLLIDALASLRSAGVDAHLVLVGEGGMRHALARRTAEKGVSTAVTFAGTVADVRPLLAIMDVFVLPSLHVETFSNAALEAMAMSRAVVLSAIGGAAEMIRDGVEGLLIAPADLSQRLPEVLRTLAEEPVLRARLGEAARRRAEESFSFERMVDQYHGLIERGRHGRSCA